MGAVVFNGRIDFKTVGRCGSSPGKLVTPIPSLQGGRLQRLLRFCHSIACTIATLAYAVAR
jgi:hypothetical protein